MKRLLAALAALSIVPAFAGSAVRAPAAGAGMPAPATKAFGTMPFAFEPNVGQADRSVKFLAHAGRTMLTLTSTEAELSLPGAPSAPRPATGLPEPVPSAVLGMTLIGADPSAEVVGADRLPGVSNYFIGNDPRRWRSGVPHYARVIYRDVYPGIDLAFYGNRSGHLEYDFTVSPGADPSVIELGMQGATRLAIGSSGELVIGVGKHTLTQRKARLVQTANGIPQSVAGAYALDGDRVSFVVGAFDHSRPLIIDPEVEYSTYLGGSTGGDLGEEFPAADNAGHVFVCGTTDSTDFPVTRGGYQGHYAGGGDAFITEMNADGSGLVYSTYLGGTGNGGGYFSIGDDAVACSLDRRGNLYAAGLTLSPDFPTTPGAFQTKFRGGDPSNCRPSDGFVAKLSPNGGKLLYSTYVGGSEFDWLISIQVDPRGNVFAAGDTASLDFPTTPGVFQPANAGGPPSACAITPIDHVVLELNPAGSALVYSTYLGGSGDDCCLAGIAIDPRGDAFVVGPTNSGSYPTTPGAFQQQFAGGTSDVAISKINPTGSALVYSTYLGGSGDEGADHIALDGAGNAYLGGGTSSTDFPVTPGVYQDHNAGGGDDFVTKLNPRGSALVFSTYLGGSSDDGAGLSGIDPQGHVYIAGGTASTDFPVTEDAFQTTNHGGYLYGSDGTITELTRDGSGLIFSTFWGGSGDEGVNGAVLDGNGNLYATGCTESTDFPTTHGAFQRSLQGGPALDAFVCNSILNAIPEDAFVSKIQFDEGDDQAKPVHRGRSGPGVPGLGEAWLRSRGFALRG